jgi:hypothetical protein
MQRPIAASIGSPLTSLVLIAGAIAGIWAGWNYGARKIG